MDKYRIDSHKLHYHIPRLNDWVSGKLIYPIYVEIGPSGVCNHRCTYCALDFVGYQNRYLDTNMLKDKLFELGKLGVKSIMYAGEGEPLMHKDIASIITHTKLSGIDVGITTNGVCLKEKLAEDILGSVEWIKIGIDAATKETYAKIRRTDERDFDRVIKNLKDSVQIRKENNYKCTLGAQLLLLPDNKHEVVNLANVVKEIGFDYLVVKPYSQHLFSETDQYKDIQYKDYLDLACELEGCNTDEFKVIFRINSMKKWDEGNKDCKSCYALPFWSHIDAGGNVWGCSAYLGDEKFYYGNIYENSFEDIWNGEKRRKSLAWVENELDVASCRVNCRMDKINNYLWELKNPPEHVNFI